MKFGAVAAFVGARSHRGSVYQDRVVEPARAKEWGAEEGGEAGHALREVVVSGDHGGGYQHLEVSGEPGLAILGIERALRLCLALGEVANLGNQGVGEARDGGGSHGEGIVSLGALRCEASDHIVQVVASAIGQGEQVAIEERREHRTEIVDAHEQARLIGVEPGGMEREQTQREGLSGFQFGIGGLKGGHEGVRRGAL